VSLERLLLQSWLNGLRTLVPEPVEVPYVELSPRVRLDDTDRPPTVPLRPPGGDRA
jgi:hypothetical protein